MERKDACTLELNKILSACSDLASLPGAKRLLEETRPATDAAEAERSLAFTAECHRLLFFSGSGKVEPFGDQDDAVARAEKGATLSCAELLGVNSLLRSARTAWRAIACAGDEDIVLTRRLASRLTFDEDLERSITEKIISVDAVADTASDRLFDIRSRIRGLNERIRSSLNEFVTGENVEYLQEAMVTMRGGRFVVPVKAEHRSKVRGFVHDRSQSGATFFVEPEYVLELNNELMDLSIDEKQEVERILSALSARVGNMAPALREDVEMLDILESGYAKAEYSYSVRGCRPEVNGDGVLDIICGRHPLLDREEAVPVSVSLGKDYRFLLLSGANTGGKTVTMKMCGLFCLMAACGIFVPAQEGTKVAIFEDVLCDIGDSQSIEESLSTFSSHMTNIIDICGKAGPGSLVLLDELGGGTNPDEGQAIAKAVTEHLLDRGCRGVITTHFTPLKEFAYSLDGIENASMEFDSVTLKPLYSIKIGLPGASNALAISRHLGMDPAILERAEGYLSEGARGYENIMRRAEDREIEAQKTLERAGEIAREAEEELSSARAKEEKLDAERERLERNARSESARIIEDRTSSAEEMLSEMEEIYRRREEITEADLIRARTIRNSLAKTPAEPVGRKAARYAAATPESLKEGQTVYVSSTETQGTLLSYNARKDEAEVLCGSMRYLCRSSDLQIVSDGGKNGGTVRVKSDARSSAPVLELNVIGMNVEEALSEVDLFIDRAVTDNLDEIKVIHGVGKGILRSAIAQHLRGHRNVASFRLGRYGEGETGVTFIKLK